MAVGRRLDAILQVTRGITRRQLADDDMAKLAERYLRRRGYDPDRVQYVVVRHHDKGHQHCVVLNRIRTDGTLVPQQYREYLRSKEVCRALERELRLRPVRNERSRLGERAPTRAEGISAIFPSAIPG